MNIHEIISEHDKGCSCMVGDEPYTCLECTKAMIEAIKRADYIQRCNQFNSYHCLRLRSQASNSMLSDNDFLRMLNKEIEP